MKTFVSVETNEAQANIELTLTQPRHRGVL